jgi:glycosyltransferase involved in cell wall biosynthesis
VLLLSKYGSLGASSRMRALQFLPYLESTGFEVEVLPLLDNSYSETFNLGKRGFGGVGSGYMKRFLAMFGMGRYDVVWLEKEFLPWIPGFIERLLVNSKIPYVVDYDDAVFHRYDRNENPLIRWVLSKKIDDTMRNAKIVVAGNSYLAGRAKNSGAERIEILPTVVDIDRYLAAEARKNAPFCVGWIGQASTVKYLQLIDSTMRTIFSENAVTLRVVGPPNWHSTACPFQLRTWSEDKECEEIALMDVGVMPLVDDDWERGKCGYKLIQYMAAGKPVIASPVGVNTEIVTHGVTGFLANTDADWLLYLRALRDDPTLRIKMGEAGRRKVAENYSLHVAAPRLANILKAAATA